MVILMGVFTFVKVLMTAVATSTTNLGSTQRAQALDDIVMQLRRRGVLQHHPQEARVKEDSVLLLPFSQDEICAQIAFAVRQIKFCSNQEEPTPCFQVDCSEL